MCGGNYYNSVTQFLQAEKTIRLRSLISMGYDIQQIKKVFQLSNNERSLQQKEEIKCFLTELENFKVTDDSALKDGEKSIMYYIAGYIAKCLAKEKCQSCNDLFTPGNVPVSVSFEHEEDSSDDPAVGAKTEFLNTVSRGGLRKPSDCIYISCVHASSFNRYIFASEELKKSLLSTKNPRETFIDSFLAIMKSNENTLGLYSMKCAKGHSHCSHMQRIAFTIFNINAKNYVSELNDKIHENRKRKSTPTSVKQSKSARKLKKMNSV